MVLLVAIGNSNIQSLRIDDQFSDEHTSSSQHNRNNEESNSADQPIKGEQKEQEMQSGIEQAPSYRDKEREEIAQALPEHKQWIARALQVIEDREDVEQKKLLKAYMHDESKEHELQNSW